MNLKEKISAGKFVVTSEIGPPKGVDIDPVLKEVDLIKSRVDAITVTDLQSSVMRVGSLAISRLLVERKVEAVFQITCRDRNRLALQSEILSAYALGIRNVLVLTGDHPALGDHPEAKGVFDLDSVQLLKVIKGLEEGHDMAGKQLLGNPKFFKGAVVNPGAQPIEPQIMKMEKKIAAGAEFFLTQGIFDLKQFADFKKQTAHIKVPIQAGIILLKSHKMANFMNEHIAGVNVPQDLVRRMEQAKDRQAECVNIAVEFIRELKSLCSGVHLMPLGWSRLVPEILEKAGI